MKTLKKGTVPFFLILTCLLVFNGHAKALELKDILDACEYLNSGDIPTDDFLPPQNAIYVANNGNDNNNGTSINTPYLHLDKAIEYANNHADTPLAIYIRSGTYYYKTCDLYQTIDRGNLYIASYQNEEVIIRPPCWPNNPTSWFDERAFQMNGPYQNITFSDLKFEGWEIIFNPGSPLNASPLRNLTIKNITASNFTHRYGDSNFLRTFIETGYLLDNVYGPGKAIFDNPSGAKYQIEGLILSNITIKDADMAVNIGDENDANVKGLRITQVKVKNPVQQGGNSSSDAFAIVNSYKILIDQCEIENIGDDGIDTKSYNVSVVNTYLTGTGRNSVKFWRNGELINSIIYNCTPINDGALIVEDGPCRVINSILMKKSPGYAGTFNYDGTSSKKFEIVNSIFIDLDHTFYVGTSNLQSKNNLYYDMPGGLFSGQVPAGTLQTLNALPNCLGNISGDPLFINPVNNNFRTSASSPCIDAGTSAGVTLPSFDYYGNPRITGNSPDIGPVETITIKDWPCGAGTLIGDSTNLGSSYEPSGIVWHSRLKKLITVSDEGDITTVDTSGNNVTTWHVGGDIEGVTIKDPASSYIYIGIENPDSIKEFNLDTGTLTGKSWDLTQWMTGPSNSGLEALTFVPNGRHPYPDSSSGGLFYAGLQYDGKIYVFNVNLSSNGTVSYIDKITPLSGISDISDLDYNEGTNKVYAIFDSNNLLVEMEPNGAVVTEYTLPGNEQEGVAIISQSPLTIAQIYIAEDTPAKIRKYDYPPVDNTPPPQQNHAPVLNTIGNRSVTIGSQLSFTINAADGDGNTLNYSVNNMPSGASFNTNSRTFTWTPNYLQKGTYTVSFIVTDGTLTDSETITITVSLLDNIAPFATATASSEYSSQYRAQNVIDGIIGAWDSGEWAANGSWDKNPWLKLAWNSQQTINKIIVYGRPNKYDRISNAKISLSTGYSMIIGEIPIGGAPKIIQIPTTDITWLRFDVLETDALNPGLTEIKVFYEPASSNSTNLAKEATAKSSSEYSSQYRAVNAIDGIIGAWDSGEWAALGSTDKSPWLKLTWNSQQTVNKIVIYGRPNKYDSIQNAKITLSNGYTITLGELPQGGAGKDIYFPTAQITWLEFKVLETNAVNPGLTEIEVYYEPSNNSNLARQADASASSEYSNQYCAPNTIDGIIGQWDSGEWAANGSWDKNPWLRLSWNSAQTVNKIVIYGRPNKFDSIKNAKVTLSNGYSATLGEIPAGGAKKEIYFPEAEVTWLEFKVLETSAMNAGLTELEVYYTNNSSSPEETPPPSDTDSDLVYNIFDKFPNDPTEKEDTDGDGIGNCYDDDDDNDGISDTEDDFPYNPDKSTAKHTFTIAASMPTSWDAQNAWNSFLKSLTTLDEINPFWYEIKTDGSLICYEGARDKFLVDLAHENNIIVVPYITNNFDPGRVHSVINNQEKLILHIQNIVNEVVTQNYDGINIDYESCYAIDRDAFTNFIGNLAVALHNQGKILSISVHAKTDEPGNWDGSISQDWYALAQAVDKFRVMTYDYSWSTSPPGAIAPVYWLTEVTNFALSIVSQEKLIMGIPFYGYDWIGNNGADKTWQEIQDLLNNYNINPSWNNSAEEPYFEYSDNSGYHTVYYEDHQSLNSKLDLFDSYNIKGISIWRIGSEDPQNWNEIKEILGINPTPSDITILCLGDSVTCGYPYDTTEKTYPARLQLMLDDCTVINHGVNGYRADQVLANLNTYLETNPDYVFLMVGGNDLAQEVLPDRSNFFNVVSQTTKEVQEIIDKVKAHINPSGSYPKIIVSTFTPIKDYWGSVGLNIYNNSLKNNLTGMDLLITTNWEDFYDKDTKQAKATLMSDSVHPNENGYIIMAQNWFEVIE